MVATCCGDIFQTASHQKVITNTNQLQHFTNDLIVIIIIVVIVIIICGSSSHYNSIYSQHQAAKKLYQGQRL